MAQKSDSALVSDNNSLESIISANGLIDVDELKAFLRHLIDSKWSRVDNAGLSAGGGGASFLTKATVQAVDEVNFKRNDSQSTVVLPNGQILCCYTTFYGLTTEDNGTARIYAKNSTDGGATWGNGRVVLNNVNTNWNVYCSNLYVRSNGTVGLVFLGKSPSTAETKYYQMTSTDNGATWGSPVQILDAPTKYTIGAFDRVFKARSGRWFLPLQENQNGIQDGNAGVYTGFYLYSDNEGVTWTETSRTLFSSPDGLVDEPGMFSIDRFIDQQANDQEKLMFYWRTRSGKVFVSESINNGTSWSAVYSLGIAAPNSTTTIINHKDVLIACHNRLYASNPSTQEARATLDLSISKDNGNTWNRSVVLETSNTLCWFQPTLMIQGDNLHVYYAAFNNAISRASLELKVYPVDAIISGAIANKFARIMIGATLAMINKDPLRLFSFFNEDMGPDAGEISYGLASQSNTQFWPFRTVRSSTGVPLGMLEDVFVGSDANSQPYSGGKTTRVKSAGGGSVSNIPLWRLQNNTTDAFAVLPGGPAFYNIREFADDTAAAAANPAVPIGGAYRTGNVVKVRLS